MGFPVGGFELGLLPDRATALPGRNRLWGVKDIDATYGRLIALGAAALEPVTEVGGGIKVAAVQDPFGNRLGLIFNPHFNTADVR